MTLDDLLTDTEAGLTERIALDLALEIKGRFGELATMSEARAFCTRRGSAQLRQRIESATEGKDRAEGLRAIAYAMRDYALERPGLSAACFRSLMNDTKKWPLDDELARTLSGIFARLNLAGEQAKHVLRAFRIFALGYAAEESFSSSAESPEYESTYELMIDAFVRGLLLSGSNTTADEGL